MEFSGLALFSSVYSVRATFGHSAYRQHTAFPLILVTNIFMRSTLKYVLVLCGTKKITSLSTLSYSIILTSGGVAQSVGHLTRKPGVLGSIPGLATYFRLSFRFFKKGSCQLLAKVCAGSTG